MTLAQQIVYAQRRARVDSGVMTSSSASDITVDYINEGVREFAKRSGGIPKEQYLTVTPLFDLRTNFAIRMTITGGANALVATDVVLASQSLTDLTGASMAAHIQDQFSNTLALSLTASWDTASWLFTIGDNLGSATYIEIGSPSRKTYVDYTDFLFNRVGTQSGYYFEGSLPMDCTAETDLPSDFLEIEYVEWDGEPLKPAPYDIFVSPGNAGTPQYYAIKNKKLRVAPYPTDQKLFHIRYKAMPADLSASTTTDTCPLPAECHWAPVYYAASMIAADNQDDDIFTREMRLFLDEVSRYKIRETNQTPTLFPAATSWEVPKVVVPSE